MSSAIYVAFDGRSQDEWYSAFRKLAPGRDLRFWPNEIGDPADIGYACVMKAPHGAFKSMPNLKAILNIGAGADYLLADPDLPDVPVARGVYDDLTMRMTEYVVLHALLCEVDGKSAVKQQRVQHDIFGHAKIGRAHV